MPRHKKGFPAPAARSRQQGKKVFGRLQLFFSTSKRVDAFRLPFTHTCVPGVVNLRAPDSARVCTVPGFPSRKRPGRRSLPLTTSTSKTHVLRFGFTMTRVPRPLGAILTHRRRPIAASNTQKSGSSPNPPGGANSPPAAPHPTARTEIATRQPTGRKSGFWT